MLDQENIQVTCPRPTHRKGRVALLGALALGLCALFLTPQTAHANSAQSRFDQAYTICTAAYGDAAEIGPALVAAGFEHQPEQMSETETLHWYVTPAPSSVTVLLRTTPVERYCAISSDDIPLEEALQKAWILTQNLFPGATALTGDLNGKNVLIGSAEGQNEACSGFWVVLGDDILWVSGGIAGQDPVCIDNGTSQIMVVM